MKHIALIKSLIFSCYFVQNEINGLNILYAALPKNIQGVFILFSYTAYRLEIHFAFTSRKYMKIYHRILWIIHIIIDI